METKLTEVEKMTLTDLISTVGGCLGLFLGLSLFSLIEIIEVLTYSFFLVQSSLSKRKISPKKKISNQ